MRLAIAIAQGVALGLGRPIVPVSTLAALARPVALAHPGAPVLAAIDARMGELYVARFRVDADADTATRNPGPGLPKPAHALCAVGAEALLAPDAVELEGTGWRGVGTGFGAKEGLLAQRLAAALLDADATALPRASDIAHLAAAAFARGGAIAPELVEPAYLRNEVALTLVQQQALRASRAG